KIVLTGVEQTARAKAVPLSPESITRGEPPSLSARGPCRHTVAGPGVTGPAGVEEQGIGTAGFPRNLGRPGPSTTHVRPETGLPTPGLPVTRAGPVGANDRRTPWYRRAKHNQARREGDRESERPIVCAGQRDGQEGSSPSGARMRGAVSESGGNSSLA